MKSMTIVFEDEEWTELNEKKGITSWRDFILNLAGVKRI